MPKQKVGRKKGLAGSSFYAVELGELNRVLKEGATVIVSRRYAEQLQLTGKPMKATTANIKAHAQRIDVKVHEPIEAEAEVEAVFKVTNLSEDNQW